MRLKISFLWGTPLMLEHHDPFTGITDIFTISEDGKTGVITHRQQMTDIQAVLDRNVEEQNLQTNSDQWGDGKIIASIPAIVYNQMLVEGWAHDTPKLRSWLNDPSNRKFRRWMGRV